MALIKINLLGKKKTPAPFGIDVLLEKAGISMDDLVSLKIPLLKAGVMLLGFYLAEYIPTSIQEQTIQELDQKLNTVTQKTEALQKEVSAKREIRRQMDQLIKEETELTRQLNIISNLSKSRAHAFKVLDNITLLTPQKIWLNRIEYVDGKLLVDGSSWEYFPINDFVKSLNESVQFESVSLKNIATDTPGKLVPGVPSAMQKTKNFIVETVLKDQG